MQRKLLLLATFFLLITGSVFAYEYTGSSTEGDSGPSSTDKYSYDLDAAFTFSGGVPDATGPSAYFGSKAVQYVDGSISEYPDERDSSDSIIKYYIENEGSTDWGQGDIKSTTIQVDDSIVRDARNSIPYLVAPPHPEAGDSTHECGDAVFDSFNTPFSCPEDFGLPADERYDAGPGEVLSDTSMTENFGSHTVNTNGEGRTDEVTYRMDLVAQEPWAEPNTETGTHVPDETNVESDKTVQFDTDTSTSYPGGSYDVNWQNVPDFYQENDNSIWIVYPVTDGYTEIGTVTNYYLEDTDSHEEWTGSSDTRYECDGSGENATCGTTNPGDTICVDTNEVTGGKYADDVDTLQEVQGQHDGYDTERTADTTRYETDKSGKYGYSVDTSTYTWYAYPTVMKPDDPDDLTWTDCDETATANEKDCQADPDASGGTSCSFTSESGPTKETNYHAEHHTADITYEYQDVKLVEKKIFDTDNGANSATVVDGISDSREALFGGDNIEGVSSPTDEIVYLREGGRAYYSHEIIHPTEQLINDKTISLSTFNIEPGPSTSDGEEFVSYRDQFDAYDADGPYGESDGYIAIEHDILNEGTSNEQKSSSRQIVGNSNLFLERESLGSSSVSYTDFVSNSDINVPACPGDQIKCVAMVDVSLMNLDSWGSTDPNSGIQFEITDPPVPTSQSMSVCKMHQRLSGSGSFSLDSSSNQQCSFEEGDITDDDCTDSNDCPPPPSSCGSQPGQRWHTMEGPEVKESTFVNSDNHAVEDDYEDCVQHSQCVLHGDNVSEGTVANVASDSQSGYESGGDSPDWEVCLNIHNSGPYPSVTNGYHENGAHEFGGQWYDLDDDRVDYYLRPGNEGGESNQDGIGHSLIADATEEQRNNPEHIAYYYRKNPNPYHSDWNPRGFTVSGGDKNYYYGLTIEEDCDQDLQGCDDSGISEEFSYTFLWKNHGTTVEDYANVRGPPL